MTPPEIRGSKPNERSGAPVYSEVMEDPAVIRGALLPSADELVVSVASAGDNVFDLALAGGRHVFGVDIDAGQIDFCRLKDAAVQRLEWREFAELAGALPASGAKRRALLERLPNELAAALRSDPTALAAMEEGGLAACGQLARFVAPLREGMLALVGRDTMVSVLEEPQREARERSWRTRFDVPEVLEFLAAALNRETISGAFIPAAAFGRMIEPEFSRYYHRVLGHLLVDLDPRDNYFLHRLWLGRFPASLPPYLSERNWFRLRERSRSITWHRADLLDFLETLPDASVHAFNLSNILDWSDEAHYAALWSAIDRTAASDARVFLRSFFADRALPSDIADAWTSDAERSAGMAAADRVGYFSRYELLTRARTRL